MMIRTLVGGAFAAALLGLTAVADAAQRHHDMSGGARVGEVRGEAFHQDRFRAPAFRGDRDNWRAGRWRHELHDGRWGWWWVVGDFWAFYPEPVYPYPAYADDEAPIAGGAPLRLLRGAKGVVAGCSAGDGRNDLPRLVAVADIRIVAAREVAVVPGAARTTSI